MRELSPGAIAWNANLWRYFPLDRFFQVLETSAIYFASANEFRDEFEGAVYVEGANDVHHEALPPERPIDTAFARLKTLTKISCWHYADYESAAMWELYAAQNKGIALCSTPERMSAAFAPFRLSPRYGSEDLWAGPVSYVDLTQVPTEDPDMLKRFFRKHRAFESEREFRLVISLRMAEEFGVRVPDCGISVRVDLDLLAQRIVLGAHIPRAQMEDLLERLKGAGLQDRLEKSTLLGRPRYVSIPSTTRRPSHRGS